jgi:phosphohistidine phosphatase
LKTLYLIRHAKSSWTFDLNDHDRPLGERGRRDVIKMGKFIKTHIDPPDLILTSTASRALYTTLNLADAWNYPEDKLLLSDRLYHCSSRDIEGILGGFDTENTIAIAGHNPTFTQFHNHYCDKHIDNIPTCGIVGLQFDINSWKELILTKATQLFYYFPKGI